MTYYISRVKYPWRKSMNVKEQTRIDNQIISDADNKIYQIFNKEDTLETLTEYFIRAGDLEMTTKIVEEEMEGCNLDEYIDEIKTEDDLKLILFKEQKALNCVYAMIRELRRNGAGNSDYDLDSRLEHSIEYLHEFHLESTDEESLQPLFNKLYLFNMAKDELNDWFYGVGPNKDKFTYYTYIKAVMEEISLEEAQESK